MKCHIIEADMMPPDMLALYLGSLGIAGTIGSWFIRSIDRLGLKKESN